MVTKSQAFIIKKICEIQKNSLEEVFTMTSLGEKNEKLMESLSVSRKEFDTQVINTWKNFEKLREEPEKLSELSYYDLVVFLFILTNLRGEYGKRYPKSINSLGKTVLSLIDSNQFLN